MKGMITPTQHEKREWARLAQAAYAQGFNNVGHKYSGAAAMRDGQQMYVEVFDQLQSDYRAWLIDNVIPVY